MAKVLHAGSATFATGLSESLSNHILCELTPKYPLDGPRESKRVVFRRHPSHLESARLLCRARFFADYILKHPVLPLKDAIAIHLTCEESNKMSRYSMRVVLFFIAYHLFGLNIAHAENLNICDRGRIGEIIAREIGATCNSVPREKLKDIWSLLILSDDQLTSLPRGAFRDLPSLKSVEIRNSLIQRLEPDTFEGTSDLLRFTLKQSPLIEIMPGAFRGLSHAWSINIYETKLKQIQAGTFAGVSPDLLTINLNNNEIEAIDPDAFRDVSQVNSILLSGNKIKKISSKTFFNLSKLTTLQIHENAIAEIEDDAFCVLPQLRELKLNDNKIVRLSKNLFRDLQSLESLWLSRNAITSIPRNAFQGTPRLSSLSLSGNQIRTIETFAFMGASIKWISLCGNVDLKNEDLQSPFSGLSKDVQIDWYDCRWD